MIISYIMHVTILISIFYCLYQLLLRKETYFQINRAVLFSGIILSFAVPFIPTPVKLKINNNQIESNTDVPQSIKDIIAQSNIPIGNSIGPSQPSSNQVITVSKGQSSQLYRVKVISIIYIIGVILLLTNFMTQIANIIFKIIKYRNKEDWIITIPYAISPCSFFGYTLISENMVDDELKTNVLLHEDIHNRQKHSLDIILSELMVAANWFNPIAWLYRKSVECNLEYITDAALIRQHVEKKQYQYNLLQMAVPNFPLSVVTNYNQKLIKRRISMMNTKKSSANITWKYFVYAPILVVAIMLFNSTALSSLQLPHDNDQKLILIITGSATTSDLSRLQSEVNHYGYTLQIDQVSWRDKNTLSELSYTLIFGEDHEMSQQSIIHDVNRHRSFMMYKAEGGSSGVVGDNLSMETISNMVNEESINKEDYVVLASFLESPVSLKELSSSSAFADHHTQFSSEKKWSDALYDDMKKESTNHTYYINDDKVEIADIINCYKYDDITDVTVEESTSETYTYKFTTNKKTGFVIAGSSSIRMPKENKLAYIKDTKDRIQKNLEERELKEASYYFDGLETDMRLETIDTTKVKSLTIEAGALFDTNGTFKREEVRVKFKSI